MTCSLVPTAVICDAEAQDSDAFPISDPGGGDAKEVSAWQITFAGTAACSPDLAFYRKIWTWGRGDAGHLDMAPAFVQAASQGNVYIMKQFFLWGLFGARPPPATWKLLLKGQSALERDGRFGALFRLVSYWMTLGDRHPSTAARLRTQYQAECDEYAALCTHYFERGLMPIRVNFREPLPPHAPMPLNGGAFEAHYRLLVEQHLTAEMRAEAKMFAPVRANRSVTWSADLVQVVMPRDPGEAAPLSAQECETLDQYEATLKAIAPNGQGASPASIIPPSLPAGGVMSLLGSASPLMSPSLSPPETSLCPSSMSTYSQPLVALSYHTAGARIDLSPLLLTEIMLEGGIVATEKMVRNTGKRRGTRRAAKSGRAARSRMLEPGELLERAMRGRRLSEATLLLYEHPHLAWSKLACSLNPSVWTYAVILAAEWGHRDLLELCSRKTLGTVKDSNGWTAEARACKSRTLGVLLEVQREQRQQQQQRSAHPLAMAVSF